MYGGENAKGPEESGGERANRNTVGLCLPDTCSVIAALGLRQGSSAGRDSYIWLRTSYHCLLSSIHRRGQKEPIHRG